MMVNLEREGGFAYREGRSRMEGICLKWRVLPTEQMGEDLLRWGRLVCLEKEKSALGRRGST